MNLVCCLRKSLLPSSLLLVSCVGNVSNVANLYADYTQAVFNDQPLGYWKFDTDGGPGPTDGQLAISIGFEAGWEGNYVGGNRVEAATLELADGRVADLGPENLALAVGFGGTEDYMSVPQSILSDRDAFTMTGWVNPGPRGGTRIGLFGQNDVIEFGFISPTTLQLWTPVGQVVNYEIDPNLIRDNTWFHVGAVGTGASIQLFINGERVSGPPGPPGYGASTFSFNIGGGGVFDGTGNQFTGSIDEVAIFNKALTEEQITTHAAAVGFGYADVVLMDDPIGYWDFQDDDGVAANRGTSGPLLDGSYVGVSPSTDGPQGLFPPDNKSITVDAAADQYVTIDANPLSSLGEFTLTGWVAPDEDLVNTRVGLFGQNDAIEFGYIDPSTIQLWTPNGGFLNVPATEVVPGEWNHFAAVGNGEELRFYLNGELAGTGGSALQQGGVDSYGESGDVFNVGGGGVFDSSGNQFTGVIDEVAVWASALTEAQIAAQFQSAFGTPAVPGDANGDGKVDAMDLNVVGLNWQMTVDPPGAANGDFDESGFVDAGDLNILALNWQFGVAAPLNAAVPEPGAQTLMLVLLMLGTMAHRLVRRTS